jgi:hypothetical protein
MRALFDTTYLTGLRKAGNANTSPPSTRARARARDGSENHRPWPHCR